MTNANTNDSLTVNRTFKSTKNPNLPLRFLLYISHLYSRLTIKANLYGERIVQIPAPEFIIFYNGKDEMPERQLLKLSDALKRCPFWAVLLISGCVSGMVELSQYYFRLGLFEFDDIFNNVLGALIGWSVFHILQQIRGQLN